MLHPLPASLPPRGAQHTALGQSPRTEHVGLAMLPKQGPGHPPARLRGQHSRFYSVHSSPRAVSGLSPPSLGHTRLRGGQHSVLPCTVPPLFPVGSARMASRHPMSPLTLQSWSFTGAGPARGQRPAGTRLAIEPSWPRGAWKPQTPQTHRAWLVSSQRPQLGKGPEGRKGPARRHAESEASLPAGPLATHLGHAPSLSQLCNGDNLACPQGPSRSRTPTAPRATW